MAVYIAVESYLITYHVSTVADFIATEASPLVRGTQIVSLMASVIFVDASVMDIVTATQSFPRFSMATSKDNVWCIAFSCILRFTQGLFAVMVSLVLVFNSDSVIDIILNFTALNFISALDDVGFELAKIGKYGYVRCMGLNDQRNVRAMRSLYITSIIESDLAFAMSFTILLSFIFPNYHR
jgi:hypothetical protein